MKIKHSGAIVALVVLLTAAGSAFAQNASWYAGGALSLNSASGYNTTVGISAYGGYVLPVNAGPGSLAVEVGYDHLGSFDESGLPPGDSASASFQDVATTAVYTWAATNVVGLYGRAGLAMWNAKLSSNYGVSGSTSGIDPMIGVGVIYRLTPKVSLRGELRLYSAGSSSVGSDIDSILFGATYTF